MFWKLLFVCPLTKKTIFFSLQYESRKTISFIFAKSSWVPYAQKATSFRLLSVFKKFPQVLKLSSKEFWIYFKTVKKTDIFFIKMQQLFWNHYKINWIMVLFISLKFKNQMTEFWNKQFVKILEGKIKNYSYLKIKLNFVVMIFCRHDNYI